MCKAVELGAECGMLPLRDSRKKWTRDGWARSTAEHEPRKVQAISGQKWLEVEWVPWIARVLRIEDILGCPFPRVESLLRSTQSCAPGRMWRWQYRRHRSSPKVIGYVLDDIYM